MTKQLINLEKYRVVHLERAQVPASLIADLSTTTIICTCLWLWISNYQMPGCFWIQAIIATIVYTTAAAWDQNLDRIHVELKAKGLKIVSKIHNNLIPWDWLKSVEIRYRGWNIIPNYVCFSFKDRSDTLILLDDILKEMDVTTLIECVRTWAPGVEMKGDVWLAKSESIATYTELWLKDSSQQDRRLLVDQTHGPGDVLNGEYEITKTLSSGGQGTAYLAATTAVELIEVPPQVVLEEFILPENDRGFRKVKDSLLREAALLRRINHPLITPILRLLH